MISHCWSVCNSIRSAILAASTVFILMSGGVADEPRLTFRKGDHVSVIGNTTADRLQHHGWLETYIHAMHPDSELTFRNLAVPGDELQNRPREDNFGSADQWLTKNETDVVFAFFGYNEAFRGPDGIDGFRKELAETIDGMLSRRGCSSSISF